MPGRLQSPPDDDTAANVREYILAKLEERKEVTRAASERAGLTYRQTQREVWDASSRQALAHAVGMSPHQLSRRLAGEGSWPFQIDEIRRIADYWGVTVDEIMNGPAREEGD